MGFNIPGFQDAKLDELLVQGQSTSAPNAMRWKRKRITS
jgi:hypothetical protein